MRVIKINGVFDHTADQEIVNTLLAAVVDDVLALHEKYPNFCKVSATDLNPDDYAQMREKYSRLLHYGVFSLPGKRAVVNELIWKWTEATGKYVGCQFWSLKAKELFDREVVGWPITVKVAKSLEQKLSKKSSPKYSRLTHEHVYPIKDMKLWLSDQKNLNRDKIQNHFERQCVGCVLLESEHDRSVGHDENPWLRYKRAGTYLALNSAWPDRQRTLIFEAGLLKSH